MYITIYILFINIYYYYYYFIITKFSKCHRNYKRKTVYRDNYHLMNMVRRIPCSYIISYAYILRL